MEAERALVVGYQGSEGAYSQLAATRHFADARPEATCRGFHSFREMLEALKAGEVDYAVLPIENSIAGSINESYDLLAEMGLSLVGEEFQPVAHCLIGAEDVPVESIRRVYSHPVALAQCGAFLDTLVDCHVEAFPDTAMAVEKVKEDAKDLSDYIGKYSSNPWWYANYIGSWNGKLVSMSLPVDQPGENMTFYKHVEGDVFRRVRDDDELGEELEFIRDVNGNVVKYKIHDNYYPRFD